MDERFERRQPRRRQRLVPRKATVTDSRRSPLREGRARVPHFLLATDLPVRLRPTDRPADRPTICPPTAAAAGPRSLLVVDLAPAARASARPRRRRRDERRGARAEPAARHVGGARPECGGSRPSRGRARLLAKDGSLVTHASRPFHPCQAGGGGGRPDTSRSVQKTRIESAAPPRSPPPRSPLSLSRTNRLRTDVEPELPFDDSSFDAVRVCVVVCCDRARVSAACGSRASRARACHACARVPWKRAPRRARGARARRARAACVFRAWHDATVGGRGGWPRV